MAKKFEVMRPTLSEKHDFAAVERNLKNSFEMLEIAKSYQYTVPIEETRGVPLSVLATTLSRESHP